MLSLFLFIVVMDWILRATVDEEDGIEWMGTDRLTELVYADDITLLSEDISSTKRMTGKLVFELSKMGLEINRTKTKVMAAQPREDVTIALECEVIRMSESFEYLGSAVCNDGDVHMQARILLGKAGTVFSRMKKVLNSRRMLLYRYKTKKIYWNCFVSFIVRQ